MICPSHQNLEDFHRGKLSVPELEQIAGHLASCDSCQASIVGLDDSSDSFIGAFRRRRWSAPLQIPEVIGKYRVLKELGKGGMGAVFLVEHLELEKKFALKLILPHRLDEAGSVERFRREMRALGRLEHPNLVRATDAGQFDDVPWVVLDYVPGPNVSQLLQGGSLPFHVACEIARQVAVGLTYLESQDLVHRDIKPSNLIVAADGIVKILDLGLARFKADTSLTSTEQVLGTLDYLAPEQITAPATADIRADVYALGCTLYKMLAGSPPFPADEYRTPHARMMAHCERAPPSLNNSCPEAPEQLSQIVAHMLSKRPGDRFSPTELAIALRPFCAEVSLTDLPTRATTAAIRGDQTQAAKPEFRRRWQRILAVVIVVVVSAAAVTAIIRYTIPSVATAEDPESWRQLLEKPPTEIIWPGGDVSNWTYDPASQRLTVHCHDTGLLGLGAAYSENYELQIGIQQNRWQGGVGLAFGIDAGFHDGYPSFDYQHISIAHHEPGSETVAIERVMTTTWMEDGRRRFRSRRLAQIDVNKPHGEQLLAITVVNGSVQQVLLNGRSLDALTDERFVGETNCQGKFGIVSSLSSSVIRNGRFRVYHVR